MKRNTGFTLTEIFIVIAVVAFLLPLIGQFFGDGWVASHRAIARVENNQLVLLLMKQWQASLHGTDTDKWNVNEKGFSAGTVKVYQDNRHLVVERGGSTKTLSLLPAGAQCRFAVEKHPGLADCAIMLINWKSRDNTRRENGEQIRFVACGKQK